MQWVVSCCYSVQDWDVPDVKYYVIYLRSFAIIINFHCDLVQDQRFSYLSEVWAMGLLNFGKKYLNHQKLGKFDTV